MSIDDNRSPFYAWLDNEAIRDLVHGALVLTPGERMVLIKGLIPGLVSEIGDEGVVSFLDELQTKAKRYAEAAAHPGDGGATRTVPGEWVGGPVPQGEVRLAETRDPRAPGGRAREREKERAAWSELETPADGIPRFPETLRDAGENPASTKRSAGADDRHADEPPRTTKGGITAPKFGSAGSGGLELEPGPKRDSRSE